MDPQVESTLLQILVWFVVVVLVVWGLTELGFSFSYFAN